MAISEGIDPVREPGNLSARVKAFLKPRARTWAFMIPLHLAAFFILYLATTRLLEQEVIDIAKASAGEQLELATAELGQIAVAHTQNRELRHFFSVVLAEHREINLRLLLPDGRVLGGGSALTPSENDTLQALLPSPRLRTIWLVEEGGRDHLRGLEKVVAARQCSQCHAAGETLAVASMRVDLTDALARLRIRSRRNVALLILAWATALGGTTAIVRASVRRSARRLEAELAAAEAGHPTLPRRRARDLALDPATAELHESLRQFVKRQRERQEEVASRLAHTDQLASLGRLAAGLAHEIKNPLAGIQGAIEIMREDAAEDAPNRELYGEMLAELKRVNETLQTLLSSARPSPPRLATTDLRKLLEDIRRLLEPGLRRQRVTLELELAPGELEARIDGAKIRQVLLNLVQNAAEAMDTGGEIVLRASKFPEGGGLIVAVEDNGPGISEEQQKKIFEPFFTTKFGGTGLGLAIARSLIEQHGGTLQIQSTPGEGTTFYILLPGGTQISRSTQGDGTQRDD